MLSRLLDRLGLYTFETYAASREEMIRQQSAAIEELLSPALRVWEGIVLLPMVLSLIHI